MTHKPLIRAGFQAPQRHPLGGERRTVMLAELVASLALALCIVIAATVLTVGIARARTLAAGNSGPSGERISGLPQRPDGALYLITDKAGHILRAAPAK